MRVIFRNDIYTPKNHFKKGRVYDITEDMFNILYYFIDKPEMIKSKLDVSVYDIKEDHSLRPSGVEYDLKKIEDTKIIKPVEL